MSAGRGGGFGQQDAGAAAFGGVGRLNAAAGLGGDGLEEGGQFGVLRHVLRPVVPAAAGHFGEGQAEDVFRAAVEGFQTAFFAKV